jgi:hypothetical protein
MLQCVVEFDAQHRLCTHLNQHTLCLIDSETHIAVRFNHSLNKSPKPSTKTTDAVATMWDQEKHGSKVRDDRVGVDVDVDEGTRGNDVTHYSHSFITHTPSTSLVIARRCLDVITTLSVVTICTDH